MIGKFVNIEHEIDKNSGQDRKKRFPVRNI